MCASAGGGKRGDSVSTAGEGEKKTPSELAGKAPVTSVYGPALKLWSTAFSWLIGALAAVAAAMIAGSQLTAIGQLSMDADQDRLTLAVGGIVVAVGLVLVSIGLLFWAQTPANTDFQQLVEIARDQRRWGIGARVRAQVAADTALNRNTGSLAMLLKAVSDTRNEYYPLRQQQYDAALRAAGATTEPARRQQEQLRDRAAAKLKVVNGQLDQYLTALQRAAQLNSFLHSRRRYRAVTWVVMFLAALSTLAFITFAWAANPPEESSDAEAAASQQPVAATLRLSTAGSEALINALGSDCVETATEAGIAVIALSSSTSGTEVVVIPSDACPAASHFTVSNAQGTVTAAKPVAPPS
jgi:hypothetical protein